MTTFDRWTGAVLTGAAELRQSLDMILTTDVGERRRRRGHGNRGGTLQDRPTTEPEIVDHFVAIAEALEPRLVNGEQYGEPRFDLVRVVPRHDAPGRVRFELQGLWYPLGHLGDFSQVEAAAFDTEIDT